MNSLKALVLPVNTLFSMATLRPPNKETLKIYK